MKEMNKKGFTLIELLAVIVILGILMMTAIPAVTKAIAKSRRNTYWQNMKSYAKAAATPFLDGEYDTLGAAGESCPYPGLNEYVIIPVSEIELEQGDTSKSSFKAAYSTDSQCKPYIIVANVGATKADGTTVDDLQWYVAGVDQAGNGIDVFTNINNLSLKSVKTGLSTSGATKNCAAVTGGALKKGTNNATLESGTGLTYKATCKK